MLALNPEQERLFNEALVDAHKAVLSFEKQNPDLDANDFSDYLQTELRKYCARFKPEKGDGKKFVNAVIRSKTRMYIEKERVSRLKLNR